MRGMDIAWRIHRVDLGVLPVDGVEHYVETITAVPVVDGQPRDRHTIVKRINVDRLLADLSGDTSSVRMREAGTAHRDLMVEMLLYQIQLGRERFPAS